METNTRADFRRRALMRLGLGFLGSAAGVGFGLAQGFAWRKPSEAAALLLPTAICFVYGSIGMIELLTRRPFQGLADGWMALQGWQRGVLGTAVVLVAFIFSWAVAIALSSRL